MQVYFIIISLSVTFVFYGDVTKMLIGNRAPFLMWRAPMNFKPKEQTRLCFFRDRAPLRVLADVPEYLPDVTNFLPN